MDAPPTYYQSLPLREKPSQKDTSDTKGVNAPSAEPSLLIRPLNLPKQHLYNRLPLNDECIAHLKFLTVLGHLRKDISETDGLFGINDVTADAFGADRPRALSKIREKRWAVYVARAVLRFERWFYTLMNAKYDGPDTSIKVRDLSTGMGLEYYTKLPNFQLDWSTERLPPIDVLMVLHSFMLSPWCFLEDCMRTSKMKLWHAGFPWAEVDACIDPETFLWTSRQEDIAKFEAATFQPWDNLAGSAQKAIACPLCDKKVSAAWTDALFGRDIDQAFEHGQGYADKHFRVKCEKCKVWITHDILRVQKLVCDVQRLRQREHPLPGTILAADGGLKPAGRMEDMLFPNRLVLAGLDSSLNALMAPENINNANMDGVRNAIEGALKNHKMVAKASAFRTRAIYPSQKLSIRRLMSRYWENSSPFALDLVGAVLRQGIFVEKMQAIDWVHSPALESTMTRLIKKYGIFLGIMGNNPDKIVVPTLDVDLAWHTHQLHPGIYYNYTILSMHGRFINHDDKIDEVKLSQAFEWTSAKYQELTHGMKYSECTCWYCEAIRESHDHKFGLLSSAKLKLAEKSGKGSPIQEDKSVQFCEDGPHISAHNAVNTVYGESWARARVAEKNRVKLDNAFKRAVQRARLAGKQPPRRSDYVTTERWGERLKEEDRAPYRVNPCITGSMYMSNPACMNVSQGAIGSCVSGACGGGVSYGSCASGASGSCGGGGGGGCGSSGGGGGGGGGCGGGGGG